MHAEAAADPILSTQRIRKVKISMVGIYNVKVRFPCLALAHMSHFVSEREPWALKQSTHFTVFAISENYFRQLCSCLWPPRRSFLSFLMLFDEFSPLYLLFVTFILYCQDGSAASVQVDMQIEAAARLKSTLSDLTALEISRNLSFGAPPPIFFGLC